MPVANFYLLCDNIIMDIKTYLAYHDGKVKRNAPELSRLSRKCGVSREFMYLMALGHAFPSPKLAIHIEHYTSGRVDRRDSLPTFPWDGLRE